MTKLRRIRTLLYNDQYMEGTELDLLHTPSLQRLYELHQLGFTDRIYIDASHSRLHHTIGVLEQVEKLIRAIRDNLQEKPNRKLNYRRKDKKITPESAGELASYVSQRRRAARLMGLLHDLTHAPYGHTLEDEIKLEKIKHDNPDRQAEAYYLLLCEYIAWLAIDEELLSYEISIPNQGENEITCFLAKLMDAPSLLRPPTNDGFIDSMAKLAAEVLTGHSISRRMSRSPAGEELSQLFCDLLFAMRGLLYLDSLHKDDLDECDKIYRTQYPFEKLIEKTLQLASMDQLLITNAFYLQKDAFLLDVIGNTICADLLDYAKRDSLLAGMKLDYDVDRIVENFTLTSYYHSDMNIREHEPMLRTAISIFSHKLRLDVPGELINLLQIRFYVYQRMLFHPTKCTVGAMLGSALQLIGWDSLPIHFRHIGDSVFLYEIREVARLLRDLLGESVVEQNERPDKDLLIALRYAYRTIRKLPANGITSAIRSLILDWRRKQLDHIKVQQTPISVEEVINCLRAGIRLLERISSRRYYRAVFRLLPNAQVKNLNLEAKEIAEFFLNASKRFETERAIEKACNLPVGGAVIHCPTSEGPQKVANILILAEKEEGEEFAKLREISNIDPKIFHKHQEAVLAIEKMYGSMWRLVVSIIPSRVIGYQDYSNKIGQVIYEKLSNGDASGISVPNDEMMTKELNRAKEHAEEPPKAKTIRLTRYDESIISWNIADMNIAEEMLSIIKNKYPHLFDTVLHAAAEGAKQPELNELLQEIFDQFEDTPKKRPPMGIDFEEKKENEAEGALFDTEDPE